MPNLELDIKQLADNGGTEPFAPLTVPEAVVFSDGDNLKDIIGTTDISDIGNGSVTSAILTLKNNISVELNVSITQYTGVASIAEYLRYSRFGKLVIVDIGGVTFSASGMSKTFITGGIPIIRSRPVVFLLPDNTTNNAACCMYGSINSTTFNCHIPATGVRYYGQAVYLTD